MIPYFIWNGVDSRDRGLIVSSYPALVRPAERVNRITIPGRAGEVTILEGEDIYPSYIKTVGIGNKRTADARANLAWLRGRGIVIFGSEPGWAYDAQIINQVDLDRLWQGVYSGTVQFLCQPYKRQVPEESPISVSGTATVTNPGDVASRPLLTVSLTADSTITIGDETIEIQVNALEADNGTYGVTIDCESCVTWDTVAGKIAEAANPGSVYPRLAVGENTVTSSAPAVITPRWRWL